MRTLKRTMCLVLALVMVLGLGVTSASAVTVASDYTDYADITYTCAVDVMTAIGVLDGMGDDVFSPEATLQREQAAKIITYLLLGPEDAEKVKGVAAPFEDVVGRWSAGFIAYCYNEGIVDGVGGNSFEPEGDLTGLQFAKMLLCALGYNQDKEGMTGEEWSIKTARLAVTADLDDGMDGVDLAKVITREQAAQMALNTLRADTVEYIYTVSNSATPRTTTQAWGANISDDGVTSVSARNPYTIQFAEEHFRKLTLSSDVVNGVNYGRDDFKRPGQTWLLSGNPVAFETDTPVNIYKSGAFTGRNAKALKDGRTVPTQGAINTGDIDVYYNGGDADDTNCIDFMQDNALTGMGAPGTSAKGLWLNDTTGLPGIEVEVYNHPSTGALDPVKYDVIVREAYVGKIKNINAKGDIILTVYEHGQVAASNPVDLTVKAADTKAGTAADAHYSELAGFSKDDYVAVYAKPGFEDKSLYTDNTGVNSTKPGTSSAKPFANAAAAIAEVAPMEPKEVVSIYEIRDPNEKGVTTTITTDAGVKYGVSNAALYVFDDNGTIRVPLWTGAANRTIQTGTTTLYTYNGYIMLFDQVSAPDTPTAGYAYLYDYIAPEQTTGNDWDSSGGQESNWSKAKIRMITSDGETTEVIEGDLDRSNTLTAVGGTGGTNAGAARIIDQNDLGRLVHYAYNGVADTYTLTVLTQQKTDATRALAITNSKSEGALPGSGAQKVVAFDSKTVFLVVTTRPDAKAQTGVDWDYDVKAYTIYNVPDISDNGGAYVTAVKKLTDVGGNGGIAQSGEIASFVLIRDLSVPPQIRNDYLFLLGSDSAAIRIGNDDTFYEYIEYQGVMDGKLQTVKVMLASSDGGTYPGRILPGNISFTKNYSVDANGFVIDLGAVDVAYTTQSGGVTDANVIWDGTAVTKVENDHIKITTATTTGPHGLTQEDYLVSKAVTVAFVYNVDSGVLKEIALSDIYAVDNSGNTPTNDEDFIYAVRNTSHTRVDMLFIMDPTL